MTAYTVNVYVFFVNGADPNKNIRRAKEDIKKTNSAWEGCVKFILRNIYFSKSNLILDASLIPAKQVFKNTQVDTLVKAARKATGYKVGIYVLYLRGDYLAEGRGKRVVGVGGTEVISFNSGTDYKLFGRILLTDKAEGRYTMAHEFGHVLFNRYNVTEERFTHDDPSGPFIQPQTDRIDRAHNNDRENLMYPISPVANPIVSAKQCQLAKQSKLVKVVHNKMPLFPLKKNLEGNNY